MQDSMDGEVCGGVMSGARLRPAASSAEQFSEPSRNHRSQYRATSEDLSTKKTRQTVGFAERCWAKISLHDVYLPTVFMSLIKLR